MIKRMAILLATISFLLVFAVPFQANPQSNGVVQIQDHIGTF